jgi:hypothetical protein
MKLDRVWRSPGQLMRAIPEGDLDDARVQVVGLEEGSAGWTGRRQSQPALLVTPLPKCFPGGPSGCGFASNLVIGRRLRCSVGPMSPTDAA